MANDTHANILLNLIMRKYGCLPDEYRIVGFDDSPIASEAIIPISTIGQQIDKRNITLKNHGRAHNPLYHGFFADLFVISNFRFFQTNIQVHLPSLRLQVELSSTQLEMLHRQSLGFSELSGQQACSGLVF